MGRTSHFSSALVLLVACLLSAAAPALWAQGIDPEHRPISAIRIEGLDQVPEQLVRNQIRSAVGEPFSDRQVEQDIIRINHLGRFDAVRAEVQPQDDNTVALVFVVDEQPLLADVQVVGNKAIPDQQLLGRVLLSAGDPADPFLIEQGQRRIVDAYEDRGYFVADVTYDRDLLSEAGILIFRVREGPRVRIRDIQFQGNTTYTDGQLKAQIRSETYLLILRGGELSREQLDLDAASVRDFYHQRGFLDAMVGRRIELSADQRSAIVTFLIEEGDRYTVDAIRIQGNDVFGIEQLLRQMTLTRGDAFSESQLRNSVEAIKRLYGELGYLETSVTTERLFHSTEPRVDLLVQIREGTPSRVGTVSVRGNEVTQDKVIMRQTRGMTPGRPFNRQGVERTERRLNESPLFAQSTVTILGEPDDAVRDVLIEVQEQSTGSINLGAGVSSDLGVIGAFSVTQRNFDIADFPATLGEALTGRAFRGAGQYFSVNLQPGSEASQYSVNFREPYFLETDYFFDTSLFYFDRERSEYEERRFGGGIGIGQRFGDVWTASVRAQAQDITISTIEPDAPVDVFAVEGGSLLTTVGLQLERNTTDSRIFPTRGSLWEGGLERAGALGGDYDFTRVTTELRQFWTVNEDFFGRRSVLSARVQLGYIFEEDEAPVFERFYAGGHRSFRGFAYRGLGPRGIRADTGAIGDRHVGGDFMLLAGVEYNFPIYGMPGPGERSGVLHGVLFTDMGTVQEDIGLEEWRVSIGTGLRIKIPFLGQAPFAIDLAVPLIKQKGDETRIISFDLALPLP